MTIAKLSYKHDVLDRFNTHVTWVNGIRAILACGLMLYQVFSVESMVYYYDSVTHQQLSKVCDPSFE